MRKSPPSPQCTGKRSPGTKDTNSSLHSLSSAAAPACVVPLPAPSPLLRGLRTLFPGPSQFLGKRLSIQSFMWEASCWHPEYMSQICPASLSDPSAKELQPDDSRSPPSILRKRPPVDQAVGEKRRAERRVRFREPEEVIEHVISCCDYVVDDRTSSGLPVLLWLLFCAVLILAVSLYYTSMKQDVTVLEEFQSRLVIFFLHIRHVAQRCWTWFLRQ
ncbi:nutritionally-regulated adipose and cardiac enriched protein homolog isoform X2 [Pyrgilauda ruficollis]|uniref:nutritionally-regulated adipose and cardiac enriched protein homolog isoform X2 n=1 Tax=Pyrgilauda ruficollis TaxID=221976 RepID=UPI001B8849C4|nr:nutritionally-regulated adipose and cardiac enriched protein homolog isoform X2 [Pyrgilauda ruficollis]